MAHASPCKEITYNGSTRKAWWLCSAGHSRAAQGPATALVGLAARDRAGKLPTATNNLAVHNPALAAQWHPSLNRGRPGPPMSPRSPVANPVVVPGRARVGQQAAADRNRAGHGCPYCAGHLATPTNNLAGEEPGPRCVVAPHPQRDRDACRRHRHVLAARALAVQPGRRGGRRRSVTAAAGSAARTAPASCLRRRTTSPYRTRPSPGNGTPPETAA